MRLRAAVPDQRNGPYRAEAAQILQELKQALECLTNDGQKQAYDQYLLASGQLPQALAASVDPLRNNVPPASHNVRREGVPSLIDEVFSQGSLPPTVGRLPQWPLPNDYQKAAARTAGKQQQKLITILGLVIAGLVVALVCAVWSASRTAPPSLPDDAKIATANDSAATKDAAKTSAESASSSSLTKSDGPTVPVKAQAGAGLDGQASAGSNAGTRPSRPADVLAALPERVTLPAPTDEHAADKPFVIGPLPANAEQLAELQLSFFQFLSGLRLRQQPARAAAEPVWQVPDPARPDAAIAVLAAKSEQLTFQWIAAATAAVPPEYRALALEVRLGNKTRRILLEFPGGDSPGLSPKSPPVAATSPTLPPPQATAAPPVVAKPPVAATPLGLPAAIELPPIASTPGSAGGGGPLKIGKLPSSQAEVLLVLHDIERSSRSPWQLEIAASPSPSAPWQVMLAPNEDANSKSTSEPAGGPIPIAEFRLLDSLEMEFAWLAAAAEQEDAAELRNCVLEIKQGDTGQGVRLRMPEKASPHVLDLDQERIDLPLAAHGLPVELLKVQILGHAGFPAPVTMHATGQPKKSDPARLVLGSASYSIQIRIRPLTSTTRHFIRIEPLTVDDDQEGAFTTGTINKANATLQQTIAEGRQTIVFLQGQLGGLQRDLVAAQSIGDPVRRNSAVSKVRSQIKNTTQRGQSLNRRLARLERQLAELPTLATIGNQLHQKASLQFRVFFPVGSYEVDVFQAL
jgi:hypothetical protein